MDIFPMEVGGERLVVVVQAPREPSDAAGDRLTAAEREVALDAAAGRSNAEIARLRGRSPRTIANQLAAVYRKLGITSRAELAIRLHGRGRWA